MFLHPTAPDPTGELNNIWYTNTKLPFKMGEKCFPKDILPQGFSIRNGVLSSCVKVAGHTWVKIVSNGCLLCILPL